MASCEVCCDLDFELFPESCQGRELRDAFEITGYRMHLTDLSGTASSGCEPCDILLNGITTLLKNGNLVDLEELPGGLVDSEIILLGQYDRERRGSQSLQAVLRYNLGAETREFNIEFFTSPNAPSAAWPAIGVAGEVSSQSNAKMCKPKIRQWLVECVENHQTCQSIELQKQMLPKRVLNVADGKVVLTVPDDGEKCHPITLSHCWGGEKPLATNKKTLLERKQGIKWDDLPKTFQDAISITRQLGVRYLWIDSLCIIQDDKRDWEEQSSRMGDIYARSYLHIAASSASNALQGFLGHRLTPQKFIKESNIEGLQIQESEVKSFRIPTNRTDQHIYVRLSLQPRESGAATRWIRNVKDSVPLFKRGWIYQERLLSPRTVHFHANEMIWTCKEDLRCECMVLDGYSAENDALKASKRKLAALEPLSNEQKHRLWRFMIEDYILLDLGEELDRLPAIAGLARMFSPQAGEHCDYLAGLWKSCLARDLLWSCRPMSRKSHGPSWSWASLHWTSDSPRELEYEPKFENTIYNQDPRLSIIDASCVIDGVNQYGAVSRGNIVLEGAICPAEHSPVKNLRLIYDTVEAYAACVKPNTPEYTVYYLSIGTFTSESNGQKRNKCRGLILRPSTQVARAFERCGSFSYGYNSMITEKNFFLESFKSETIILV